MDLGRDTRGARAIEREIGKRVSFAIHFAGNVLDHEVLELPRQLRGALVQRLQICAFHFVAPLHLPDEKLGIAANAKRLDVVGHGVVKRGQERVVFSYVVRVPTELLRPVRESLFHRDRAGSRRRKRARDCRATRRRRSQCKRPPAPNASPRTGERCREVNRTTDWASESSFAAPAEIFIAFFAAFFIGREARLHWLRSSAVRRLPRKPLR